MTEVKYCPLLKEPCRADCAFITLRRDPITGEYYPAACALAEAARKAARIE